MFNIHSDLKAVSGDVSCGWQMQILFAYTKMNLTTNLDKQVNLFNHVQPIAGVHDTMIGASYEAATVSQSMLTKFNSMQFLSCSHDEADNKIEGDTVRDGSHFMLV